MRLNELSPGKGAKKKLASASDAATLRARARRADAARKASTRVRAAITRSASKAARCPCSGVLPKVGFYFAHGTKYTAELRLHELAIPDRRRH